MTEPRNKYTGKKLDVACEGPGNVKKLNFSGLNKVWGGLGAEKDDKKKPSANGPDPKQEAEQYNDEMDLSKVDNDNKTIVDPAFEPKKEAKDKFENGILAGFEKLNKVWGGLGPEKDDKKKPGSGEAGVF
jgi:hypothetical protein